jgi:hypothetical protein
VRVVARQRIDDRNPITPVFASTRPNWISFSAVTASSRVDGSYPVRYPVVTTRARRPRGGEIQRVQILCAAAVVLEHRDRVVLVDDELRHGAARRARRVAARKAIVEPDDLRRINVTTRRRPPPTCTRFVRR